MTETLLPYQVEGVAALVESPRFGLFDSPGLGKTAQAIRGMDQLGLKRGVIVCPASARGVWVGEFRKFSLVRRRVLKGLSSDDLNLWLRGRADVLIVSYEKAVIWRKELAGELMEFCVFDEAHYLKNARSQRTRAALGHDCKGDFGYARWAAYVWFLTGTPMANDPSDIWTWLRFCQGTTLTLRSFADRYFTAKVGAFSSSYTPRKETLAELQGIIKAHSVRRTIKSVGLDLPDLWVVTQAIEGDTREVVAMLKEHPGLDTAITEAVDKGGLKFLDSAHSATLRRLVGEAKAPVFAQQLLDELAGGLEKVVVMCAHTKVVSILGAALAAAGVKYVRIDGSVSDRERDRARDAFQNDPETKVFIGNIIAAGTAITLTAAHEIVMLEWSWSPADNMQAIKRVHRIGQGHKVRARFISLVKSIDDEISEVVARKTKAIAMVEGEA